MNKVFKNIPLVKSLIGRSFNRKLKKELNNQQGINFPKDGIFISKVGILFSSESQKELKAALDFGSHLKSKRIKVSFLSYLPVVEHPELLKVKVYSDKEINGFGIPSGLEVSKFLNKEFDLLLAPCEIEHNHFQYIIALSKASIKVGPAGSNTEYLDVLVQMTEGEQHKQYYLNAENIINSLCPN